jgi:hypothetical protein
VAEGPQQQLALSQTEFEEAAAKLAAKSRSADAHALFLENLAESGADNAAS